MNYNLLDEKWIPVLYRDGRWDRVGIRKALADAGRIRQIAASNPMDRVAILRFLLALLYWCKGNPPDEGSAASDDSFPADWFSKLDTNKHSFNLLGEGRRFYQVSTACRTRAATDLLQEIPTGNNFWHFRHSIDKADGLCRDCCAMGLLRLPLFSVSGLPDLKAGINGTPPLYVLPWGKSLLVTLRANWAPYSPLGDPAWIKPDIRPTPGEDVPLLTGLTLLSRRVWLRELPGPPGMCNGCGAKRATIIRTCEFQTGGKQQNDLWNDPHVLYSNATSRKALKAADLTAGGRFRMDRPWPDLLASIIETGKLGSGDEPLSLLVVGFATDKAKNIDVWERLIAVPSTQAIQETAAAFVQQWQKEGRRLEKRIARSKVEGASAIASIRPDVEGKVSARAAQLLAGGEPTWEQVAHEYRSVMKAIAGSLSPGFTTAVVQRRQFIGNLVPNMQPEAESAKKPKRTRGSVK